MRRLYIMHIESMMTVWQLVGGKKLKIQVIKFYRKNFSNCIRLLDY